MLGTFFVNLKVRELIILPNWTLPLLDHASHRHRDPPDSLFARLMSCLTYGSPLKDSDNSVSTNAARPCLELLNKQERSVLPRRGAAIRRLRRADRCVWYLNSEPSKKRGTGPEPTDKNWITHSHTRTCCHLRAAISGHVRACWEKLVYQTQTPDNASHMRPRTPISFVSWSNS